MNSQSYDDKLLVQYLLGGLDEAKAEVTEVFDELSVTDDEFAARLRAVEDDLVDAYVRMELREPELTQFQSYYLASPHRREKVKFAQSFQALAERKMAAKAVGASALSVDISGRDTVAHVSSPAKQTGKESVPWRRLSLFTIPNLTLQRSFAAAAILMLVVIGWLVFRTSQMRSWMDQAQAERKLLQQQGQELQAQLDQQRAAGLESEKELERVREKLARLEQRQVSIGIVSFGLIAGGTLRGPSGAEQIPTITIPPGTDYVSLQLDLPPNGYSAYRAELWRSREDPSVWESGKLKARDGKIGRVIDANIPAGRLNSKVYVIEVIGIPSRGTPEKLADYRFRVKKQ